MSEQPWWGTALKQRLAVFVFVNVVMALCVLPVQTVQAQTESVLYSFTNSNGDGRDPWGQLAIDANGNLYGTTSAGGAYGNGTVFELVNSNGSYSERILYSFSNGGDGVSPEAGLIMDQSGNLYGTTSGGGASGCGTVFELVNSNGSYSERILYSFSGGAVADGRSPAAGLVMDSSGNLYGTTYTGGGGFTSCKGGCGTVFELVNSNGSYSESILYTFLSSNGDGQEPLGGLIMDTSGNLYGTTVAGGSSGVGTVFELVKSNGSYTESILYTFSSSNGDGQNPRGSLVMDTSGNLYGTTIWGGASGFGTVFELVNSNGFYTETLLHSFQGSVEGLGPESGLIMDQNGNLYGTANGGGSLASGTVFELVNSNGSYTATVLHSFSSGADGASPYAGVIMDQGGNLYGTTQQGGASNGGTVFKVWPACSQPATTTTLTSSNNPANAGGSILFSATVACVGGAPTGQITFSTGSTWLGSSPVAGGQATLLISAADSLGIGTFAISAQFQPGSAVSSPSSATINQLVNEAGVVVTSGGNTLTGNQTVNGTVNATSFTGNGSGLTNVSASLLNCVACVGNSQLAVNYAGSTSQGGPATSAMNALMFGGLAPSAFQPAGSYATLGSNLFSGDQNVAGNAILNGTLTASSATLSGSVSAGGSVLNPAGTATGSQGFNSGPLDAISSVFNSTAGAAQKQLFRWQAEPATGSNNTAAPSATLNLLFGANGAAPAETGLSVNANGTINFVPGQTFPNAGAGTVTGVTAGTGLLGGGTNGNVPLSVNQNVVAFQSDLTNGVNTAEAFATSAVTTAQANAISTSEGYSNKTFVPITGGAMTGTLNAPTINTSGNTTTNGSTNTGTLTIDGGTPILKHLSMVVTPAFANLSSQACSSANFTLSGAADGDTLALGIQNSMLAVDVSLVYTAWVSTANTVTMRVCNVSATKQKVSSSGKIRIDLWKH